MVTLPVLTLDSALKGSNLPPSGFSGLSASSAGAAAIDAVALSASAAPQVNPRSDPKSAFTADPILLVGVSPAP
jgi:hypothetical protein